MYDIPTTKGLHIASSDNKNRISQLATLFRVFQSFSTVIPYCFERQQTARGLVSNSSYFCCTNHWSNQFKLIYFAETYHTFNGFDEKEISLGVKSGRKLQPRGFRIWRFHDKKSHKIMFLFLMYICSKNLFKNVNCLLTSLSYSFKAKLSKFNSRSSSWWQKLIESPSCQ